MGLYREWPEGGGDMMMEVEIRMMQVETMGEKISHMRRRCISISSKSL